MITFNDVRQTADNRAEYHHIIRMFFTCVLCMRMVIFAQILSSPPVTPAATVSDANVKDDEMECFPIDSLNVGANRFF